MAGKEEHQQEKRQELPMTKWRAWSQRLILWLGTRMPVTRVVRRLGLTPPRYNITDEKFTHEAGHRTYVPAMVQQELRRAIDDVEQTDEEPLRSTKHGAGGSGRSVAMKVTGHRSESVYRRYAIVSDADLQEASRKLTGRVSGIVANTPVE